MIVHRTLEVREKSKSLTSHLDPVDDPLVVGLVLQQSVQLLGELFTRHDLLLSSVF